VADIGCGNGHLLSELRAHYPELKLFGVEFTPELAQVAIERELPNCLMVQGDCRDPNFLTEKVDLLITERMLINLLSDKDKEIALSNIAGKLRPQGRLLMIESFVEPWRELNRARAEMRLPEIPQSRQNRYMSEEFLEPLFQNGVREIKGHIPANALSAHFYLTRIFHHLLRPEGGKLEETEFVSFFDRALPPGKGNFSPILMRVFEKIS
jgi:trans-aconitate methyltransferase